MGTFSMSSGISTDARGSELDAATDLLMEQLLLLEAAGCGINSPAVSVDLAAGFVEVEVGVDAETVSEATKVANACIRAAIHALGGATPNWNQALKSVSPRQVVRL